MQHEPIDDYIYEVMRSSPEQLQAIRQRVREFKAQAQAQEVARPQTDEIAALKAERDELDKDLSALLSVLDAHDVTEGVETARYWKQSIKRLMDERDKAQAVVVNELPKDEKQSDLSGESEKQETYARLKAYAKAGARIRCCGLSWRADEIWVWDYPVDCYEVHPDDLHMVPEYAPKAKAEPATFEAHGKVWTRHTPGDPMPCDREANVCVTFRDGDYSKPGLAKHWSWDKSLSDYEWIIGWRYADPADQPKTELEIVIVAANEQAQQESAQPTTSPSWTPTAGDVVSSIPEMALGGQMYWRDLALQLAHVWWKCYKIGASLQHGDLDKDIAFSIVCGRHGGRVFHGYTPENAWYKAEEWLLSPDRENFPAACLTPAQP